MNFIENLKLRAQQNPKRIVFAEGTEPRVIAAAAQIEKEGLAIPILFTEAVEDAHQAATEMLARGEADAMISGPTATSRERILPALKLIGPREPGHRVSGAMIMVLPSNVDPDAANGGVLLFADCAVNISPSPEELAQIAIDTADTAKQFGLDPVVALLSFSTAGSTEHPLTLRIREAAALARSLRPDLSIEGEVQVDAALIDSIGHTKDPKFALAGQANVLIFPELEAGNIGYKLVERLAGATAIGPILQGLAKPVNELSRGCSTEDIVNLAALTCIQAQ
jgi:phosphate acetyltransferase